LYEFWSFKPQHKLHDTIQVVTEFLEEYAASVFRISIWEGNGRLQTPQHNVLLSYMKLREMLNNPSAPCPSSPRPLVIK
jgi:hypothetical protein